VTVERDCGPIVFYDAGLFPEASDGVLQVRSSLPPFANLQEPHPIRTKSFREYQTSLWCTPIKA